MLGRTPWILGFVVVSVGLLSAEERDHTITVDDYFTLSTLTEVAASPDGSLAAYVELRWDKELDRRNADIWVVNLDTRETRRLTFDDANEGSPVFSPDGRMVYFTSARKREGGRAPYNGKTQVWRVPVEGGAEQAVTREAEGIESFRLSRDGKAVYFKRSRDESEGEFRELREKFSSVTYGMGTRQVGEIWRLNLDTWRTEKVCEPGRYIHDFAVSPDQGLVAMITTPDERLITNEGWSRIDVWVAGERELITLEESPWRSGAPSPYGWLEGLAFSDDSQALAFAIVYDGYPTELFVADWVGVEGAGAPRARKLERPDGPYFTGGLRWRPGGRDLCALADFQANARVFCFTGLEDGAQGETVDLTPNEVVISAYDFRGGNPEQLVTLLSNTALFGDVVLVAPVEHHLERLLAFRQITDVNPHTKRWKLPKVSRMSWKGADGKEVDGILELPPDYDMAVRLPLIVELHGGPTGCSYKHLRYWIYGRTLFASRGYALLSPNYRGSTGYGDEFLTDLIGRENDIDVSDILGGIDLLVQRRMVDPKRVGVMGWSNGGYLTNCLITLGDRFRAASSGASVVDQLMQWGTQDTPGHNINYMRGLPWERREAYLAASPSWNLDKVRAATLIHCGEGDERTPVHHSRLLFRALRDYGNVPTQLLIYPDQGHGLTTYTFRRAKLEWDVAWFDRYLLAVED